MPLDATAEAEALHLSRALEGAPAEAVAEAALERRGPLVSSYGAGSAALLHIVAGLDRDAPVIVLDTEMLFPETSDYVAALSAHLGLRNVRRVHPEREAAFDVDPDGILHLTDPRACCALRKRAPLSAALKPFGAWMTGRRRIQTAARAAMPLVEAEDGRLKFNPLAGWGLGEVAAYIERNSIPPHPLVERGFRSIGCAPCTTAVAKDEDRRAGRWRGTGRVACGMHEGDRA